MRFNLTIIWLILVFTVFADQQSIYEIDGTVVRSYNKTNGPKALVKLSYGTEKNNSDLEQVYSIRDSFQISLKDSIYWLEMEKNTDYTICIEEANEGLWKGNDFSYKKEQNCILLNSGNYVKNGKIWYVTKFGNVFTFNILVGMKYIDLSKEKHKLGYFGPEYKRKKTTKRENPHVFYPFVAFEDRVYPDPPRLENINKVLIVDKYKVTDCEIIQALWDSIPNHIPFKMRDNQMFWIKKKNSLVKNGYCDAHDSAAINLNPYLALMYANARSLRDGLKPVYSFEESEDWKICQLFKNGNFGIRNESLNIRKSSFTFIYVDSTSNGYRLPYYDEWMALARGGEINTEYVWGDSNDSVNASQYAWFGIKDPRDPKSKITSKVGAQKALLEHSCGRWWQTSRPVGMLKPNSYNLYDMSGLVCEIVMLPGKSIFHNEILSCKGGFLADPLDSLNLGRHCDYSQTRDFFYYGLRLVREVKK